MMEYPIFDFEYEKRKPEILWDMTEIEKQQFKDRVVACPSFARLWSGRYDFSKTFLRGLKSRISLKLDDHVVIHVIGRQGIGKSRAGQIIGKKLYSKLWLENITFSHEESLRRCESIRKGSIVIQDELVVGVGMGAEREALEFQNVLETTRDHRLSFILISPTVRKLSGVHYVLEVIQRSIKQRKLKIAIRSGEGYTGYFIIDVPKDEDDKLYMAYLPYMRDNKKKIRTRQMGVRVDFRELAEKVTHHPRYSKYIDKRKVMYLIREQNPRLTELEVMAVEGAYSLYVRYSRRPESVVEHKKRVHKHTFKFRAKKGDYLCVRCGVVVKENPFI